LVLTSQVSPAKELVSLFSGQYVITLGKNEGLPLMHITQHCYRYDVDQCSVTTAHKHRGVPWNNFI